MKATQQQSLNPEAMYFFTVMYGNRSMNGNVFILIMKNESDDLLKQQYSCFSIHYSTTASPTQQNFYFVAFGKEVS